MSVEFLTVNHRIRIPQSEFEFSFSRSSGPGGQNVNKVSSKATLRWNFAGSPSLPPDVRQRFLTSYGSRITTEGDLLISSQLYRDQPKNIDDCLEKLRQLLLAVAVAPKTRKKTRPTRGSKERRLESKRGRSETKRLRRGPGHSE